MILLRPCLFILFMKIYYKILALLSAVAFIFPVVSCQEEKLEPDPESGEEQPELNFTVSSDKIEAEAQGGEYYLTVTPADIVRVSYDKDAEWFTAGLLIGAETENLKISVKPNEDKESRSGEVTLSAEGCDDFIVIVTQSGALSGECELLSFGIDASANGLDTSIKFDFDKAAGTLDAMYLKWIDKSDPEMLVPVFDFTGAGVYVNDQEVISGKTAVSFAEDFTLVVKAENGDSKEYTVSLNCPQINTELPVLRLQPEREIVDKENYVNTKVTLYSPFTDSGWWSPDDEPVEVRGRGNSTWILPKKPYRLKFPEKVSPIGLDHTKAKSWVILAHDMDKSLLRNHLAFAVSRILFNPSEGYHDPSAILFTPCSQFVNVYMNDEYHGLYQMSDHMEQREGRIAVEELTDKDGADPEKITGGYIVETDLHEGNHFSPMKGIKMSYKYPDDEEYDPAQYEYITNFIGQMEAALYSSDFKDPQNGWRKYLDEKTLIDFIIVKEFCGDLDGYTSTYMYKRRGVDKLFFGPIWDVDKGWDNDKRIPHSEYPPKSSLMMFAGFWMPAYVQYDWFQRLWDDETFRQDVSQRWNSVRDRLVSEVNSILNTQPEAMKKAIEANFEVWPFYYQASEEANMPAETYPEEIERIRQLTDTRADLLDNLFR